MKELILGGVRSGKSALAQCRAADSGREVVYVATATAGDEEMATRIERHRADRPADWQVAECPIALAETLQQQAGDHRCLLVDCLTLWLTNLLCAEDEALLTRERDQFLKVLPQLPGQLILVSNETNMGIVPMDALSRRFCDEAGRLHQALAQRCDRVTLTVAGLPMIVKG